MTDIYESKFRYDTEWKKKQTVNKVKQQRKNKREKKPILKYLKNIVSVYRITSKNSSAYSSYIERKNIIYIFKFMLLKERTKRHDHY